jgi:uncharacterized protein
VFSPEILPEEETELGIKYGYLEPIDRITNKTLKTYKARRSDSSLVFEDMWKRGFYMTRGSKFGGNFLAYVDDPRCVHSKFIVRVVEKGTLFEKSEFILHTRMYTTTLKRTLIAVVDDDRTVRYFEIAPGPEHKSDNTTKKKKVRIIVAPGNGGCGKRTQDCNWYGWFHGEMLKRGHDSICCNWPDPYICHQSKWIPFCVKELKCDEHTIVVGHSTGALMAMRLAETQKVGGLILVSAAHTDLGDEGERASGYFDTAWDWESQKKNAGFIHQFHSKDDHLIPVAEARFVAHHLKGPNHVYEELDGYSHFFRPFKPLLDAVDRYVKNGVISLPSSSSSSSSNSTTNTASSTSSTTTSITKNKL